jgi:hypothetical protein
MNNQLYITISNTTAFRANRVKSAHYILSNEDLFPDLLGFALDIQDSHHQKACWILELVLEQKPTLISEHLSPFCQSLPLFENNSAIRAISKICMFMAQHLTLSYDEEQQITECCLDWLIAVDKKVATKAYGIRALYELGKRHK